MANRERGEISLAAGDQTYTLKLTMNACCELEDRSGKLFDQLIIAANRGSMVAIRWFLWAALQEHHAATVKTPDDAGHIVDLMGGIESISKTLDDLMALNKDERDVATKPEGGTPDPQLTGAANGDASS